MKILVIGGSGPIGYNISKYFSHKDYEVHSTYYKNKIIGKKYYQLDITNNEKTVELIKKINPEILIHCAALAGVDLAEKNHQLADTVTVEGTKNVIEGCKIIKSKCIYVSTSFVYNNKNNMGFENDKAVPNTYYGKTKLRSEEEVISSDLEHLILRTDQPYYWTEKWQKENSVMRVLKNLRNETKLNEVIDWFNVPTFIPDFVKAIDILIQKNKNGIFNVVGNNFVNRYEWSCKVAEIFGLDKNLITPIKSQSLDLKIERPNINISNKKLIQETGIEMKGIIEGAKKMYSESLNMK